MTLPLWRPASAGFSSVSVAPGSDEDPIARLVADGVDKARMTRCAPPCILIGDRRAEPPRHPICRGVEHEFVERRVLDRERVARGREVVDIGGMPVDISSMSVGRSLAAGNLTIDHAAVGLLKDLRAQMALVVLADRV